VSVFDTTLDVSRSLGFVLTAASSPSSAGCDDDQRGPHPGAARGRGRDLVADLCETSTRLTPAFDSGVDRTRPGHDDPAIRGSNRVAEMSAFARPPTPSHTRHGGRE